MAYSDQDADVYFDQLRPTTLSSTLNFHLMGGPPDGGSTAINSADDTCLCRTLEELDERTQETSYLWPRKLYGHLYLA